jgi:hypothetical protein
MRLCFGSAVFGIEPVYDYLDYITDIPGFNLRYVSWSPDNGGYGSMRHDMLACLERYVSQHPGTKKCGMAIEQMLDAWIKRKSGNA